MKKLDVAKTRLEALKQESKTAIDSGKFSKEPVDVEGITPQTRLEWLAPSVDYILGVAAGLPEKEIEASLNSLTADDEDSIMLAFVGYVQNTSGDPYVEEGKRNIVKAMAILAVDAEDDDDSADDEGKSLLQQMGAALKRPIFSKGKKGKAKAKPEPKKSAEKPESDNEAELKELKVLVAKLQAQKAEAEARAEKAEAEAKALKAKLIDA